MAAADDANSEGGKPARTLFQVVESYRNRASWLVLLPLTGRTHQLRVHCAALGTPIIGDGKYGGRAAFPEALAKGAPAPKILPPLATEPALPEPPAGLTLPVPATLPPHQAAPHEARRALENRGKRNLQPPVHSHKRYTPKH